MAIRPTHKPAGGLPRYFFVGRKDEISIFAKTLESNCAPDEYSILTISALGGQGKSSLLARMRELLKEEKYAEFPSAAIDFDLAAQRDPVNALILLRNQFAAAGVATNAFDIAFARHFVLTRPGRDIRADHPELFKFSSDLLGDVADTLGSIITELPGAKLVYSILSKLSHKGLEWYRKRGEPLLAQLDEIPTHHLRAELPMFLGADLSAYCAEASNKRLVIFYDTHEALWRGTQRIDSAAETAPDSWLRRFVQETPRILHVIAGRRPLDWPKIDEEWSKYITSIDLRELDDESADEIFDRAALTSQAIRKRILQSSLGHALTLRVNVRIYETLIGQGKTPEPEDFPLVAREAFDRFFDHLDVHTRAVIRALAIPSYIDDEIWAHLAQSGIPAFSYVNRKDVLDEVYFRKDEEGRHLMHELVRDGIRESLAKDDPALLKQLHEAMFAYHDQKSRLSERQLHTKSVRESSLAEAADHLIAGIPERFVDWCIKRFSTDLATFSTRHRERLLREAHAHIGEVSEANWQAAIKLARVLIRARPFSLQAHEQLLATASFWKHCGGVTLSSLRHIAWIYEITNQPERAEKITSAVRGRYLEEPDALTEGPLFLELLLALKDGTETDIARELRRVAEVLSAASTGLICWSVLGGLVRTKDRKALDVLKNSFKTNEIESVDGVHIPRALFLCRLLDVAIEQGVPRSGIEIASELCSIEPDNLSEFIAREDTLPRIRARAIFYLNRANQACGMNAGTAAAEPEKQKDKMGHILAEWREWTEANDMDWSSEELCIAEPTKPWEGVEDQQTDYFVDDEENVCVMVDGTSTMWRELDYFIVHNELIYFVDRKFGTFHYGLNLHNKLAVFIDAGIRIHRVSLNLGAADLGAATTDGSTHYLFALDSDEPVANAIDFSRTQTSDRIH
ncbi:MAG: hypothetical protein KF826_09965 [Xanthobacteraceae bacterium]|nr:hypothetical protein [Xanthobacteraceae bacterium]MCW5676780.1 hypothetical protein [Xanthobacteraceae bacterium]